jgi:hypothetical protein
MQKTMAEVRKVAAAIGWSPETLARAWEVAGIAIAADPTPEPVVPWREAYTTWMLRQGVDLVPEQDVWKAAVMWCDEQVCAVSGETPGYAGHFDLILDRFHGRGQWE